MFRFVRTAAIVAPLLVFSGIAFADEPCSGTLCDLFHGSSSDTATPPAPAAPHVMTVPTNPLANWFGHGDGASEPQQPAAASTPTQSTQQPTSYGNGFFHLGGGGVANRNPSGECSGTACDLYHGHSSGEDVEPNTIQDINGIPQSSYNSPAPPHIQSVAATRVAQPAAPAYVPPPAPLPVTTPTCAHSAKDPWSCYRR